MRGWIDQRRRDAIVGKAGLEKNEGQVVSFCAGHDLELKLRVFDL